MSTLPIEQFVLFDVGIDVARLRLVREDLMRCTHSVNTGKAYRSSCGVFARWCVDAGRRALPATAETVGLFVTWCIHDRRYRLETVRTHLSALRDQHLAAGLCSPVDACARELVNNAARVLKERPAGKAALTADLLRRMSEALGDRGGPLAARDRALLVNGFAAGWRRSEMSSLDLADVDLRPRGVVLTLGASKADQDGSEGRVVGLGFGSRYSTCPVRLMRDWLKVRGRWPGALFCRIRKSGQLLRGERLSGDGVNGALKRALALIGEDVRPYGAHSLRAGMATAGIENGASVVSNK